MLRFGLTLLFLRTPNAGQLALRGTEALRIPGQLQSLLAVGNPESILMQAAHHWEFSYAEVWKFKLVSGQSILTLDESVVATHRNANPNGVSIFREASKEFSFKLGEGIPGRVWENQKCEFQNNVQQLDKVVFLRQKIAPVAGFAGAVAKAIMIGAEVVWVICAFLNEPLDSCRGAALPLPSPLSPRPQLVLVSCLLASIHHRLPPSMTMFVSTAV